MNNVSPGIIIVDMVNDFVSGKFGSETKQSLASKIGETLHRIPENIPLIFTQDSHILNDPEFRVWGEHCLAGEWGSEICPELSGFRGYRLRKRHYDAFFETDLDGYLRAMRINHLYIFGISTDICVLHTVSGAFHRYIPFSVPKDLCAAIDSELHEEAIAFMKRNYGARIIDSSAMVSEVNQ